MGRSPCCDKSRVKRGSWSPEEDATLKNYLLKHGTGGNWISLPQKAGLRRCGKSCRLRWLNYLRPDIKHGAFTQEEDGIIYKLHSTIGSRWSVIASHLPGRTDNSVKNHWNSKLRKRLIGATSDSKSTSSAVTNAETVSSTSTTMFFDKTLMIQPGLPDYPRPTFPVPFLHADNCSPATTANFATVSYAEQPMNYSAANSSIFSVQQDSDFVRLPSFSMMNENYYEVKSVPVDEEYSFDSMAGIGTLVEGHGDLDLCSIFHMPFPN